MNRRELAKNGFLGFCGFVLSKLVLKQKERVKGLVLSSWGTDSNVTYHIFHVCLDDKKTDVPPGWEFLNDPVEDIYNG